MNSEIVMKPIPENACVLTKHEFMQEVLSGVLTDYDGVGAWATEKEYSDIGVQADIGSILLLNYPPDKEFTHIIWFNC